MQIIENTDTSTRVAFNSIADMAAYVAPHGQQQIPGATNDALNPSRNSAGAAESFAQSLQRGHDGGYWPEGAARMKPATLPADIMADVLPGIPRQEIQEAGFRPCVPAYLAGSPKAMWRTTPSETPNRLLKIGVNIAAAHYYTPAQLLDRGAAILSVLDALQADGYSVELWACYRVKNDGTGRQMSIETLIKDSTDSWSPDSVAFALASAGFSRCLNWRVTEILGAVEGMAPARTIDSMSGNGNGLDGPDFDCWYRYPGAADQNHWASADSALTHAVKVASEQLTAPREVAA